MKIAILGHCGSGKSTLARQLGEKYFAIPGFLGGFWLWIYWNGF